MLRWIKLIHTETHINSLQKSFPLGEKISQQAVAICLDGVDRIMKKKIKMYFAQHDHQAIMH